jgi:putative Mn2+ efflux pump MntP
MLIVKVIIAVLLGLIVLSLAISMLSLVKGRSDSNTTVKFLTIRIVLSIVTFVFIAFSFYMGWLQPHGIVPMAS